MGDPTLAENSPRVFKSGRLIPEFQSAPPMPKELTFGSFGFSVGSQGFTGLIDVVQQEFDDATIRVKIPPNGIIDVDAKQAKRVADACRARIWKPGIKFSATHDFLTQDGLLEFLAGNTLNAFLYDYLPKAGISSAVDQALTVRRPVAITRSVMFRHLFDLSPPITIENASLHEIIGRGIEPYADLLREWSPANLVARYEQIVDTMLSAQAAPAASGRPPQIDRRAVPQSSENSMGHLAKRIARGLARRARGHVLTPGRQFAKALQVRITGALGITTSKSRFNRILDDAARAEYADVIDRLQTIAPDILAKKIPRANIQQAFIFDAVQRFAKRYASPRIICIGSFEDSAAVCLKRLGYAIEEIDPAVNGLDLSGFVNLPTTRLGSYDIVFSTSVLEHVRDDEKFISQMAALLAPGGFGVLTCDFKEGYKTGDPVVQSDFRFYTKRDLAERLTPFMKDCRLVDLPNWDCTNPDFQFGGFRYTFATLAFRKAEQSEFVADWANLSPADQARFYTENGFLVIPAALTQQQVKQPLAEIAAHGLRGTTENVWRASFARDLVVNPKLLTALKAIFGDRIKFFKAAYVETPPKPDVGGQRQALHVDYGIGEPEGDFRNSSPCWVNVAYYLTDLTADHSPLWVCAGTNRRYDAVPASHLERFADRAKMVLAKAGDAVLFHANTVHAASHNLSSETRHALFYSYRPAWSKPVGPVAEWPQAFIDSFASEHRGMLGDLNRGL